MKVKGATLRINSTEEFQPSPYQTIVIFGVRRGGTTSVARIVQELGIFLGPDLSSILEDINFRKPLGLEAISRTVDERNAQFDVWGWKHPQPYNYIRDVLPQLRNPKFIFVTRDITANAMGIGARENRPNEEAVNNAYGFFKKGMSLISYSKVPTLFVSYEKLLVRPEGSIEEIASFVGAEPEKSRVKEISSLIVPGQYLPVANRMSIRRRLLETKRLWIKN